MGVTRGNRGTFKCGVAVSSHQMAMSPAAATGQPLKISTQLNRHQRAVGCEARCSNTTSAAKRQAEADKEFPEAWERKSRPTIRSRQLSRESLTRLRHYQGQPREI